MKLIDLLKQELPKRGGWPDGVRYIVQDGDDYLIKTSNNLPTEMTNGCVWRMPSEGWGGADGDIRDVDILADDWNTAIVTREQYEAWIPPVGTECEYKLTKVNYRTDFSRGKVLAYGVQKVFMEHWSSKNEFIQSIDSIEFRPIRTEREKGIEAMLDLLNAGTQLSLADAIEQLYDAGYRKV